MAGAVPLCLLAAALLSACGDGSASTTITVPTETSTPSATPELTSTATSVPTQTPTPTPMATHKPTPTTKPHLEVAGPDDFVAQVQEALRLLAKRAPEAYVRVEEGISTIRHVQVGSGMDVYSKTYMVGIQTAFAPGFSVSEQGRLAGGYDRSRRLPQQSLCLRRRVFG